MRKMIFCLVLFSTYKSQAHSPFSLMSETRLAYISIRQVVGVSYTLNSSQHHLYVGYDNAYSTDKRNFGVGYQYSYTLENGIGLDANFYARFGEELNNGSSEFGGAMHYCRGTYVIEEAIGIHYQIEKKFFNDRLELTPFVRISFAQGFDQVQEVKYTNLSYACEIPLRDNTLPFVGMRYSFRL